MHGLKLERNRRTIFRLFLYSEELSFSEVLKKTGIGSSLLAYFLKKMVAEATLEKKRGKYRLTEEAEKMIPFFAGNDLLLSPLPVVLVACVKEGKILLSSRHKRPFKGFWSLPSGRLLISERIKEACERIMPEKYSVNVSFRNICAVIFERLEQNKKPKHGFVFFLAKAEPISEFKETGSLKWFDVSRLKKREVIASDHWMITELLSRKSEVFEETISESRKMTRFTSAPKRAGRTQK